MIMVMILSIHSFIFDVDTFCFRIYSVYYVVVGIRSLIRKTTRVVLMSTRLNSFFKSFSTTSIFSKAQDLLLNKTDTYIAFQYVFRISFISNRELI
jgi:hypothetical protein